MVFGPTRLISHANSARLNTICKMLHTFFLSLIANEYSRAIRTCLEPFPRFDQTLIAGGTKGDTIFRALPVLEMGTWVPVCQLSVDGRTIAISGSPITIIVLSVRFEEARNIDGTSESEMVGR